MSIFLLDLWNKILGGTNPGKTADANGDFAEQMQWLTENAGASPYWLRDSILRGLPAFTKYYSTAYGILQATDAPPPFMTSSAGTLTWLNYDATEGVVYIRVGHTAVGSFRSTHRLHYDGQLLAPLPQSPLTATPTILHLRWHARFLRTSGGPADFNEGIGLESINTTVFDNGPDEGFHFYVHMGDTTWRLTTGDGSTKSTSSQAGADNNWHDFHIEWKSGEIRFYVDDVLTITKTTNIPDGSVNGLLYHLVCANTSTNGIDIADFAIEWE